MKLKKVFPYILWVVIALLIFVFITTYVKSSQFRWSQKVCNAIRLGETETALQLIDKGIQKGYNLNTLSDQPSFFWTLIETTPLTPLQAACKYGNYVVAEKLVESGAVPKAIDGGLSTEPILCILRRAYSPDDKALIQLLLDNGAVLSCNDGLENVLTNAAQRAPQDFNAKVDSVTGLYPYDEAVAKGITEVFLLLAEYCDGKTTNEAGRTPLHCAVLMGNWHLVRVLVSEFDYSLNAEDMSGNTAYDLAIENEAPNNILSLLTPD